jgi:multidrug efflux pump subunit AcrA (membrane-fusion protein)
LPSESALVSAKAQAQAVKAQATNLASTRKRFEDLFREGAVSEQQLDDIVAQHDAVQAQLVAAEASIRQAEDGIQTNQVNLKMRKAQLLQAQANLNAAEVQRENAFVRAPFNGVITSRNVDPGAMANVGQPVFRLEQMNPVKVIGSLAEKDLMSLKPGETKVSVKVDLLDKEFKGVVDKVYPAIAAKTRTGRFEVVIDNPDNVLRSGMYATIMLALQTEPEAMIVSKDSLLSHSGQMFAIRVNRNGIAERVQVKIGIIQGSNAQVLDGLQAGVLLLLREQNWSRLGLRLNLCWRRTENELICFRR